MKTVIRHERDIRTTSKVGWAPPLPGPGWARVTTVRFARSGRELTHHRQRHGPRQTATQRSPVMGASAEDAVRTFRAPAANPVRGSVITKCGNSPEGIRSDNFSEREPFVQELVHLDSRHVGPTPQGRGRQPPGCPTLRAAPGHPHRFTAVTRPSSRLASSGSTPRQRGLSGVRGRGSRCPNAGPVSQS